MKPTIASGMNPTGEPPVSIEKLAADRQQSAGIIDTMSRLVGNADFIAFTKYLRTDARKAAANAKDVDRYPTAEQRDAFAQRHIALTEVIDFADGKLEAAQERLKKLDEKIASLRPVDAQA